MKLKQSRLYQRVFALNAAIFVIATMVLVLTPATVSFPVEATEAIVLVVGLSAILLVNAIALRTVFGPLERLTRLMRAVNPQRPGARLKATGPAESWYACSTRCSTGSRASASRAHATNSRRRRASASRIAHELHDEVGQLLTGVLAQLEALVQQTPSEHASDVRRVQETARQAIEVLSRVVRDLRPEALDELGLANALEALASRVEQQGRLIVNRRIENRVRDLGPERELVVYRVAQEALTNALRHSRASTIALTLEARDTHVFLSVRDDGIGLPNDLAARHGILGMRERSMRGEPVLYPSAIRALIRHHLEVEPAGLRPILTPRETEVVKLIAEAYNTKEIAQMLVISPKTVERHRANILEKLGMRDRVELTRYAIRQKLIEP